MSDQLVRAISKDGFVKAVAVSTRNLTERALISLGPQQLESLIEEQGSAELRCQFCDNVLNFTCQQLEELLSNMMKKA